MSDDMFSVAMKVLGTESSLTAIQEKSQHVQQKFRMVK